MLVLFTTVVLIVVPVLVTVTPFSLTLLVFNTKLVCTGNVVVLLITLVSINVTISVIAGGVEVVFEMMRRREVVVTVGVGRMRMEVASLREVVVLKIVWVGRVVY